MTDIPAINPYLGPFAFTSNDEDRFFGRKRETQELISLIRNSQLTILFGTSGTGKTSLIQAKLLPQLKREYFHPIYLRINFGSADPLDYTRKRITEELRKWQPDLPDFESNQSLLNFASKTVIFKGLVKPVLFFDQFEELLTLGPKNDPDKIQQFITELSDLIELRLSDDLKNSENVYNLSNFKVVFSLRQDWIAYLEDFSHSIPSVLENRYRLKRFSAYQAYEAIYFPAMGNLEEETVRNIILEIGERALSEEIMEDEGPIGRALKNLVIDPFVLSLYCFQLHEKCVEAKEYRITSELVKTYSHEKLIRNYYDEKTNSLPDLKKLIEDSLLNESGKRLTLSLDKFTLGDINLSNQFKELAATTGVIRIIGEDPTYEVEIIHDQLANQIFESRVERKAREKHEEAERKEAEAERLRASAKRAQKTTTFVVVLALTIIGIGMLSTYLWTNKLIKDARANNTIVGLQEQLKDEKSKTFALMDSLTDLIKQHDKAILSNNYLDTNSVNLVSIEKARSKRLKDSFELIARHNDFLLANLQNQKTFDSLQTEREKRKLVDSIGGYVNLINNMRTQVSVINAKPEITKIEIRNPLNPDGSINYKLLKNIPLTFAFQVSVPDQVRIGNININVKCVTGRVGHLTTATAKGTAQLSKLMRDPEAVIKVDLPEDIAEGDYSYEIFYLSQINSGYVMLVPETKFKVGR